MTTGEGGRHAEALLHTQRVGGEAISGSIGQVDLFEDGDDTRSLDLREEGKPFEVGAPGEVWVERRTLDERSGPLQPGRGLERQPEQCAAARRGPDQAVHNRRGN